MSVFEVAYQICTPAVSGCLRALWLCVRVDFLWDLWWLAEATQTWPHLQRFYGTRCLRLWSPLFLAVVLRFHALPQRFSGCYSQFGLQCEDFLSFTRPFTSFPDSFFFFLTPKTSNLFPHSLYPPPPCLFSLSLQSSFLLSPVSFFLSLSLCLVKGPTVRRPGSCGFHANRLSGSGKSKEPRVRDRATEWERESARLSQASQNCFCTEEHNDNTSHPCKTGRPRTGTRASRIPSSCYA